MRFDTFLLKFYKLTWQQWLALDDEKLEDKICSHYERQFGV